MEGITDAYPELERERKFFPLGVENPARLTPQQVAGRRQAGELASGRVLLAD